MSATYPNLTVGEATEYDQLQTKIKSSADAFTEADAERFRFLYSKSHNADPAVVARYVPLPTAPITQAKMREQGKSVV